MQNYANNRKNGDYKLSPLNLSKELKSTLEFSKNNSLPEGFAFYDKQESVVINFYPDYVFPKYNFFSDSNNQSRKEWIDFANNKNNSKPKDGNLGEDKISLSKVLTGINGTRSYYYFTGMPYLHDTLLLSQVKIVNQNELIFFNKSIDIKQLLSQQEYNDCVTYDTNDYPKFENDKDYFGDLPEVKKSILAELDKNKDKSIMYTDFISWLLYLEYKANNNTLGLNIETNIAINRYQKAMQCLLAKLDSKENSPKIQQNIQKFDSHTANSNNLANTPIKQDITVTNITTDYTKIDNEIQTQEKPTETKNIANLLPRTGGINLIFIMLNILISGIVFVIYRKNRRKKPIITLQNWPK